MLHTLLYFFALFSLSTSSNWAKLNQMPVEVLGFYRLGIAALLLALWVLLKKIKISTHGLVWGVLSGFFFFLHLWTYKYAAKNTSIANVMILFSSNPIWTSLGALIFFKEKFTKRLVLSYFLALLGVYILVAQNLKLDSAMHLGNISSLLSALFYAIYMLTGKKARHFFNNTSYAFIQYSICAIFFGLCVLESGAQLTGYSTISWVAVLGLILLPTFLGHFSLTYLVNHMNLSLMTCGKLIEPVMASIIAYFLFNEVLSPYAWISFALTATSVLVLFAPSIVKDYPK